MRVLGIVMLFVGLGLCIAALATYGYWNLSIDPDTIARQRENPPMIPWEDQATVELVVGAGLFIPSIWVVGQNPPR